MKKNISINIGGIIFHIEEDGFEKLRNYLDSINSYFATFEDSREIIEDIESRIAEIFLTKLNEVNQVISLVDVEDVIATMGTTKDFDATIETEPAATPEAKEPTPEPEAEQEEPEAESTESKGSTESSRPKRLYRDKQRRVFGGVAAGIAYYAGVDPIWIRLGFLALFVNAFLGELSGFTLLTYIILWIVLPAQVLEEDKKVKKLFRDRDKSVIGGVCSGLAAYFGTDRGILRLLFFISIFLGGAGIIIYLILWIITPQARTITEKMQMEGEPVTITNIEENVKKRLDEKEGEESPLARVLLFPFRLIALIISGFAKILGPSAIVLVEIIRIIFGIVIMITGFAMMLCFIIAFLVIVGWAPAWWTEYVHLGDFPVEMAFSSFAGLALLSAFVIVFVPALALTLAGVFVTLKRRVGNAYLGWSLFGIWVIGLIGAAFFFPAIVHDFKSESSIREQKEFPMTAGTPTLRLNELWINSDYESVDLRIRGHEDSVFRLEMRFESRGADRQGAQENARAVDYIVTQNGDDFVFDSDVTFPEGVSFRFQQVDATFYVPNGKVFRMDRDLNEILTNTLYMSGYRSYQMEDNDWVFENGRLRCLQCQDLNSLRRGSSRSSRSSRSRGSTRDLNIDRSWGRVKGEEVRYSYADFEEVRISSNMKVYIEEDDTYEVILKGDENDLEDVYINQRGSRLEIKHRDYDWDWWERKAWRRDMAVYISLPDLEALEVSGACIAKINGFNNRDMELELNGASEIEASISPDYLQLRLRGASIVDLEGNARKVKAELIGASKVRAFDFRTSYTDLTVRGASSAEIYVTEELDVNAAGLSSVTYKGNARVRADEHGLSSIQKY